MSKSLVVTSVGHGITPMNSPRRDTAHSGSSAAFYSYAYPEPPGYAGGAVRPAGAGYSAQMREFVLPYEVVRTAADPDAALLDFCQSTYEIAADLGRWDRTALDR